MADTLANPDKIGVVNRDRKVDENSTKMDGMVQQNYHRKLWSALFTFMPSPMLAGVFNPDAVNNAPGRELHSFNAMPDDKFWDIDPAWHYIPSLDLPPETVKGCHFSEFSPWLNPEKQSQNPAMFWAWEDERAAYVSALARHNNLCVFDNLGVDLAGV